MYLFGSIRGDIGTGGGLYTLCFVRLGVSAEVSAEVSTEVSTEVSAEVSVEDVDAVLMAKIRGNPASPPLPYRNWQRNLQGKVRTGIYQTDISKHF